jgi:hypothetical protein
MRGISSAVLYPVPQLTLNHCCSNIGACRQNSLR